MTFIRTAAVVAAVCGAALGLASPASADLVAGTYNRTGDGPGGVFAGTRTVVITSCGPGCVNIAGGNMSDELVQMHLEGNTWTGSNSFDQLTIDNGTLTGTESGTFLSVPVNYQYVKVG